MNRPLSVLAGTALVLIFGSLAASAEAPKPKKKQAETAVEAGDAKPEAATKPAAGAEALDTIVVTAGRREIQIREAPATVSVVRRKDIDRKGGSSVAELLRDVPGVQVDESSIPGLKRIRIRGEDAKRSLVLIDGQEVTDHTTYGPPLLIDPALIERIEVVRGPLSVLYGSRAIGGVINIITRKPSSKPVEVSVGGGYDSGTRGYTANGLASGTIDGFTYRMFAGRTENTTRVTPEGELPNTSHNSKSLDARLGWSNDTHSFAFGYDRLDLSSRSSTPPGTVGGTFTAFQLDMPRRDREKFAFFYEGKHLLPGMEKLSVNAFRQTVDRRFLQTVGFKMGSYFSQYYDHDDADLLTTTGVNVQSDWTLPFGNTLVVGAQYLEDTIDKEASQVGWYRYGAGPQIPVNRTIQQDAYSRTWSAYAQNTWAFAEDWKLVTGLRQNYSRAGITASNDPAVKPGDSDASRTIGSATLLWSPSKDLTLRAGWGQGFVTPTLMQMHTGTFFGSGFNVRPNANLKPETSNSFEIGARWNDGRFRAEGTVFYTDARDYIASTTCATVVGVTCTSPFDYAYTNINRATTMGAELTAGWKFLDGYEAYGNLTHLKREYFYPTFSTTKSGVPDFAGRFGVRWDGTLSNDVDVWADAYMRAGSKIELESSSRSISTAGGWSTANFEFGTSWKSPDRFGQHSLSVALTNLTDRSYKPALEELTQTGRAVMVNFRSTF